MQLHCIILHYTALCYITALYCITHWTYSRLTVLDWILFSSWTYALCRLMHGLMHCVDLCVCRLMTHAINRGAPVNPCPNRSTPIKNDNAWTYALCSETYALCGLDLHMDLCIVWYRLLHGLMHCVDLHLDLLPTPPLV